MEMFRQCGIFVFLSYYIDNRVMLKKRNHVAKMILPDDGMKSLLQTFYRRHLDLVDHLEISISQMTKDLFLFTIFFLSSNTNNDKTFI